MAYGESLQPLEFLKHLYLGIFLSPEELVENHVDFHAGTSSRVYRILESMSKQDCRRCQYLFEPLAYQELLASLRVAQFVKSLETISWETWCDYSSHDGSQGRHMDDQLEEALEGSHTVVRIKKAFIPEESGEGISNQYMEGDDDSGSSQTNSTSTLVSVSESSIAESDGSQVSNISEGDKGREYRVPRAGFRLNMKVIREGQRVRIQRLEPDLHH